MTIHARITLYSHFFVVDELQGSLIVKLCSDFAKRFDQWGFDIVEKRRKVLRKWCYAQTAERYVFHRSAMPSFIKELMFAHLSKENFEWVEVPVVAGIPMKLEYTDTRELFDYQKSTLEFFSDRSIHSPIVTLDTGKGKSAILTSYMNQMQQRIVMVIRPMYIDKWESDLNKVFAFRKGEILKVQGSKVLDNLIALGPHDTRYKAVLISNKTMKRWFNDYEENPEAFKIRYGIEPWQLMQTLGVDTYYVDERHQDLHFNFLLDLNTHCQQVVCATATLISKDVFVNNMMHLLHPAGSRVRPSGYNKHTHVYAMMYVFADPGNIRTSEYGRKEYSHNAFEASIIRNKMVLSSYFEMIAKTIERFWIKMPSGFKEGDKCLVFCSTVQMCGLLVKYLQHRWPQYSINRYTQEDDYQNLLNSDICVSTVLSAGTAHDIPQLTTAILTQALSSITANLQALGRLRDLRDGRNPSYVYFSCEQIDKHMDYHAEKIELFSERGLVQTTLNYAGTI